MYIYIKYIKYNNQPILLLSHLFIFPPSLSLKYQQSSTLFPHLLNTNSPQLHLLMNFYVLMFLYVLILILI